jgi:hypothetical protein
MKRGKSLFWRGGGGENTTPTFTLNVCPACCPCAVTEHIGSPVGGHVPLAFYLPHMSPLICSRVSVPRPGPGRRGRPRLLLRLVVVVGILTFDAYVSTRAWRAVGLAPVFRVRCPSPLRVKRARLWWGGSQREKRRVEVEPCVPPADSMDTAAALEALRKLLGELGGEVARLKGRHRELEEAIGKAGEDERLCTSGNNDDEEMEGAAGEEAGDAMELDDGDDDNDIEAVGAELEATRRMLGLVEATEQQLAGLGLEILHDTGPASLLDEVRARAGHRQDHGHMMPVSWCNSPLLSSGLDPRRPMSGRRLSRSPRGLFPGPCGRTTCCHC